MKPRKYIFLILILLLAALVCAGCSKKPQTLDELMGVTIQEYEEIGCARTEGTAEGRDYFYNRHHNYELLPELRDILSELEVQYDRKAEKSHGHVVIQPDGAEYLYNLSFWSPERNKDADIWFGGDGTNIYYDEKYYDVVGGDLKQLCSFINATEDYNIWGTAYGTKTNG